ncbi:hypothetical protein DVA86_29185 [Streptomyces armeniacus]|uniref:Uncharacterized protein n=1 Tax=Streptomyces armeniacus TaxID=83291 RepID=A0A345XWQ1_9ACTN|nr:hypothetical protein DVA86_29185 [Streptomyces armeniacus]
MYAILRGSGPGGAEQLTVWTRDKNEDAEVFDALKDSITGFLHEQGDPPEEDYVLDVFGPDGSLLHRLDARV